VSSQCVPSKERTIGRSSLLDDLSCENPLINFGLNSASTNIDTATSSKTQLDAMDELNKNMMTRKAES
jgi:hypothetical protein